jgi:putative transposase
MKAVPDRTHGEFCSKSYTNSAKEAAHLSGEGGQKVGNKGGQLFIDCPPLAISLNNSTLDNNKRLLSVKDVAHLLNESLRTIKYRCKKGAYKTVFIDGNGGKQYRIHLSSLPQHVQNKYYDDHLAPCRSDPSLFIQNPTTPVAVGKTALTSPTEQTASVSHSSLRGQGFSLAPDPSFKPLSESEIKSEIYARLADWERKTVDKYLAIFKEAEGLKGKTLKSFVGRWNEKNPHLKTSYERILRLRAKYIEQGISGLVPGYGKSAGRTKVKNDALYDYFKTAYLKEGAPSLQSCWTRTMGFASTKSILTDLNNFPAPITFLRRLERELPEDQIYRARHGFEAWNRKYGYYLDRDYSKIKPGEILISDHAQVDVLVRLSNGKIAAPWVTAFRDFKTSKWLGWLHHAEAPNSDHVFQAFYFAVRDFGRPTDIIIDNGKDYRVRDFAGGRKRHSISHDEYRMVPMLTLLGVTPHFAIPRNAQAKPIERDFLKNKEWFSKHLKGYRGGNVKERPEALREEVRRGDLLSWEEYCKCMDLFITDILNKTSSQGKVLQGRCPDEAWESEVQAINRVSPDSLKLFCMRTSETFTIGRNGVRDGTIGVTYYAPWMDGLKGKKCYLRRDPQAYQEAWVFRADNDEFIGMAAIAELAPALARTPIEKQTLKDQMTRKRRIEKASKTYFENKGALSHEEALNDMARGIAVQNESRGYVPGKKAHKVFKINKTRLDGIMKKEKKKGQTRSFSLSDLLPPEEPKKEKIYGWLCEKEWDEKHRSKEDQIL